MSRLDRTQLPPHLLDALTRANGTISGKDQAVEPLIERERVPKDVETILTTVRTLAYNAATERVYALFAGAGALIKQHHEEWSATDRRTAWAFFRYLRSHLLAYLEDPHPFGGSQTDATAWHEWVSNGVQAGRQIERLSQTTQGIRDLLQHSKVASHRLVAPHVVSDDRSVPRHLSVPTLQRQFNCPAWAAQRLQVLFLRYSADVSFVRHYADEAKRRSYDAIFLELDFYSLQMAAVEPDRHDALSRNGHVTSYEEGRTELGRYVRESANESNEGGDDDEGTTVEDPGYGYEAIEYHPVPSDRDLDKPQYDHPLSRLITSATRETLPSVGKQLHELQKTNGLHPKVAGYLWLLYRIQEERVMCPFMRWAINELDKITSSRVLAKFGQQMHALAKRFTSNERKLFWAKYHTVKAQLATQQTPFGGLPATLPQPVAAASA